MARTPVMAVAIALAIGACGGGGDETGELGEDVFGDIGESSGDVEPEDQGSVGATEIGPVTQTADPGTGWVEVEGERYEFDAFGATHYRCELLEDRITINFQQTASGHELTLQGGILDGQWNASLTFVPDAENQVNYGANIGFDPGRFGIDEEAISYEGTVTRVEDFDVQNSQEMQATIAINCSPPGGVPSAEIGGESFTFPLSGASSLECVVSEERVEVLVGQSQPEYRQLQIDIEDDGAELFGAAHVTTDDGTFTSFVPPNGTGLVIEGTSLTYEGIFTDPSGEDVEGTVSVTCG